MSERGEAVSGSKWTCPPWLRAYEAYIPDLAGLNIEEVMNSRFGRIAEVNPEAYKLVAVNAAVGLLTALRAKGLLKEEEKEPAEA